MEANIATLDIKTAGMDAFPGGSQDSSRDNADNDTTFSSQYYVNLCVLNCKIAKWSPVYLDNNKLNGAFSIIFSSNYIWNRQ